MKAKIYTTPTCAFCKTVEKFLDKYGVEYVELDASQPEIGKEAVRLSGATTVPVTVLNGHVIVGWKPAQLRKAIEDI